MNAVKENTFRTLKGKELLMTSLWCRFGWHNWTKYNEPEEARDSTFVKLTVQTRRCGSCNLADRIILFKE